MGFDTFTVYEATILPLTVIWVSRERQAFCQLPTAAAFVAAERKHCNKKQIVLLLLKSLKEFKGKELQFLTSPIAAMTHRGA